MRTSAKRRLLGVERLEQRLQLAGDTLDGAFSNWHNESHPADVNGDGHVSPVDALIVINVLTRFDQASVEDMQADWYAIDPDADELYGGYHPDVDASGSVTALDALRVINQLERIAASPQLVPISVMSDGQGNALQIVYSVPDGRSKEVDVSQWDVSINWTEGAVFATDSNGEVLVIAKPGVGILEVDNTTDDGQAIVTRLLPDGTQVTERYVCVPGVVVDIDGNIIQAIPDDVRRPIEGFEEVIGAIVERRTLDTDGSEITLGYEEAAVENLISVTATLATGESVTVNLEGATSVFAPQTIMIRTFEGEWVGSKTLSEFEWNLRLLLIMGYRPLGVVTPYDIHLTLEAEGGLWNS